MLITLIEMRFPAIVIVRSAVVVVVAAAVKVRKEYRANLARQARLARRAFRAKPVPKARLDHRA